jgi:hypothetical protein
MNNPASPGAHISWVFAESEALEPQMRELCGRWPGVLMP